MTLTTLYTMMTDLCGESNLTTISTTVGYRYVNAAMHEVAAWLITLRSQHMISSYEATISNASAARLIFVSPTGYTRVKRIWLAYRSTVLVTESPWLEHIEPDATTTIQQAAVSEKPPVFVYNEQIAFVYPKDGIKCMVYYFHALDDMTAGTDAPGQAGGVGTANKLPTEYQPMIAMRAAIMALTATNRDTTQLQRLYDNTMLGFTAELGRRTRTASRG